MWVLLGYPLGPNESSNTSRFILQNFLSVALPQGADDVYRCNVTLDFNSNCLSEFSFHIGLYFANDVIVPFKWYNNSIDN